MTAGDKKYMVPLGAGARIPWRAEAFDGPCPLEIVVTEGELDALALLAAGWDAVALGGATPARAVLDYIVDAAGDAEQLALWTDNDLVGDGAVEKLGPLLAERWGAAWVAQRVVRWRSSRDAAALAAAGALA